MQNIFEFDFKTEKTQKQIVKSNKKRTKRSKTINLYKDKMLFLKKIALAYKLAKNNIDFLTNEKRKITIAALNEIEIILEELNDVEYQLFNLWIVKKEKISNLFISKSKFYELTNKLFKKFLLHMNRSKALIKNL